MELNRNKGRYTEKGVPLKASTEFFDATEYKKAFDHARSRRSYLGVSQNSKKEIIGYYVSK
jgi:hypothetical protein